MGERCPSALAATAFATAQPVTATTSTAQPVTATTSTAQPVTTTTSMSASVAKATISATSTQPVTPVTPATSNSRGNLETIFGHHGPMGEAAVLQKESRYHPRPSEDISSIPTATVTITTAATKTAAITPAPSRVARNKVDCLRASAESSPRSMSVRHSNCSFYG